MLEIFLAVYFIDRHDLAHPLRKKAFAIKRKIKPQRGQQVDISLVKEKYLESLLSSPQHFLLTF